MAHSFTTVESDRTIPDISQWQAQHIHGGTTEPLLITVDDQLDYGSLFDAFSVNKDGKEIPGNIKYDGSNNSIAFYPTHPWDTGSYSITFLPFLEDVAGNNLVRLFDRDIKENATQKEHDSFRMLLEVSE